jgi:hypothetical protein
VRALAGAIFPSADEAGRRVTILAVIVAAGVVVGRVSTYDPTLILGATLAILWGAVFTGIFRYTIGIHLQSRMLRRLVLAGLAVRVPIVVAHLVIGLILLGGQVDFIGYFGNAERAAGRLLQGDFSMLAIPEEHDIGGWLATVMFVPIYLILGPSLVGTFVWSAVIGFLGGFFFLRAYHVSFGEIRDSRFYAACLFFYPAVAFWSSLLGKDSWMFFFLGFSTWGFARFLREPRPANALLFAVGAGFVTVLRTPIGAALCVAAVAATLIASRRWMRHIRGAAAILRPIVFVGLGAVILVGGYSAVLGPLRGYGVIGSDSPSALQGMLNLAVSRHVGMVSDSGSAGTGVRISEATVGEALRFLPEALLTFFFRPHLFEAHNALAMIAATDGTLLALVLLFRLKRLVVAVRLAPRTPLIVFALVACGLFSAGLSFESNLGAIVRHRIMVLPFLFLLLSVPREESGQGAEPA